MYWKIPASILLTTGICPVAFVLRDSCMEYPKKRLPLRRSPEHPLLSVRTVCIVLIYRCMKLPFMLQIRSAFQGKDLAVQSVILPQAENFEKGQGFMFLL